MANMCWKLKIDVRKIGLADCVLCVLFMKLIILHSLDIL
jgi:hypothetical protein